MTFQGGTVLRYEHLDRAAAGLRGELGRQLLVADIHELPLWDTVEVEGARLGSGTPCAEYAIAADERFGVWRATTPEDRRAATR